MRRPGDALVLTALSLAAAFSGAAALIYQINWQRQLTALFGVHHYSVTAIVLVYFLGFAVGALIAQRWVDRFRRPLLFIVAVELVIAAFALVSPAAFALGEKIQGSLHGTIEGSPVAGLIATALISVALLIVPTVCMGATLPAFYRVVIRSMSEVSTRVGVIMGMNTTGAVTGSAVATFYLMGSYGRSAQLLIAAALNVSVALLALWLLRRGPASEPAAPAQAKPAPSAESAQPSSAGGRLLAAYALTGAAGLGLEIVWMRIAYMSLDQTIYTFSLTLTIYLLGYALGSLVAAVLVRRVEITVNGVAAMQLLVLLTTVAGFAFFSGGMHVDTFRRSLGYFPSAVVTVSAFLFLPTFFMGLATPPMLRLLSTAYSRLGRDTGRAHLVNYLGSVVAVIVVGFVLIPRVSLRQVILVCLLMVAGCTLLLFEPRRYRPLLRGAAVVVLLLPMLLLPRDLFAGHVARFYENAVAMQEDEYGLWGLDRKSNKVTLRRDGRQEKSIKTMREQGWGFATLPAVVQPKIEKIFLCGLGLGVDADVLLRFDDVKLFRTAELSRSAESLARQAWEGRPDDYFLDDRFELLLADARQHLTHTDERYDAIISGTVRISSAGSTHLYSVEYWEMVRERLAPGGVLLQWLPTFSKFSARVLMRSFVEVFPDPLVVQWGSTVMLMGFRDGPPELTEEHLARIYERRPRLSETQFPDARAFFEAMRHVSPKLLEEEIPINRDDFPVAEFSFRGFDKEGTLRENGEYMVENYTEAGPPPAGN